MIEVGEHKISFEEYRYFYMNYRNDYINSGVLDYDELIKNDIENAFKTRYAKIDYAASKGIELTDEEKESAQAVIDSVKDLYGDSYESVLEERYLTEDVFRMLQEEELLESKIIDFEKNEYSSSFLSDDKTVEEYVKENFYRAKQILIKYDEKGYNADEYDLAHELKAITYGEEDFEMALEQYGEDLEMDKDGYCSAPGTLGETFENAVLNLQVGEISDVVESDVGYHIIMRLPIDDEYISNHFEDLRETYKEIKINELLETKTKEMTISYSEYYNTISENMLVNNLAEETKSN